MTDFKIRIFSIGAGYVGGPTMAVIALKCPDKGAMKQCIDPSLCLRTHNFATQIQVRRHTAPSHKYFSQQLFCVFLLSKSSENSDIDLDTALFSPGSTSRSPFSTSTKPVSMRGIQTSFPFTSPDCMRW